MKTPNYIVGNPMNGNKHVPVFLYTASRVSGIAILTAEQLKSIADETANVTKLLKENLVVKVQCAVSGGYWDESAYKYKSLPRHSMLFLLVGKNPVVKLYNPLALFSDIADILEFKNGEWGFKKSDLLSDPEVRDKETISSLEFHLRSARTKIPKNAKIFIRPSNRLHKTMLVKIHYEL